MLAMMLQSHNLQGSCVVAVGIHLLVGLQKFSEGAQTASVKVSDFGLGGVGVDGLCFDEGGGAWREVELQDLLL